MKTERSEGCLLEHHNECNYSLSLTHPSHTYWLVLFRNSTARGRQFSEWVAPLDYNLWAYLFGWQSYCGSLLSGSIQRILSCILISMIDFPERKHDDRTSQTECHYIKLRSRCLTKTPKKTPINNYCWQCFKTPDYPSIAPKNTLLRLVIKERKSIRVVVSDYKYIKKNLKKYYFLVFTLTPLTISSLRSQKICFVRANVDLYMFKPPLI